MVRMICGEKGAFLGSGRGPWTVQVSLRPDVEREARPAVEFLGVLEGSSSRYADPDAEGVTPVLRTSNYQLFTFEIEPAACTYTSFEAHLVVWFFAAGHHVLLDPWRCIWSKPVQMCPQLDH